MNFEALLEAAHYLEKSEENKGLNNSKDTGESAAQTAITSLTKNPAPKTQVHWRKRAISLCKFEKDVTNCKVIKMSANNLANEDLSKENNNLNLLLNCHNGITNLTESPQCKEKYDDIKPKEQNLFMDEKVDGNKLQKTNGFVSNILQNCPGESQENYSKFELENDELSACLDTQINSSSCSVQNDSKLSGFQGSLLTREAHNRLEKSRRAHLKDCFEKLKSLIPSIHSRRTSNGKILHEAEIYVQSLKHIESKQLTMLEDLRHQKVQNLKKLKNLQDQLQKIVSQDRINQLLNEAKTVCEIKSTGTVKNNNTVTVEKPDISPPEFKKPITNVGKCNMENPHEKASHSALANSEQPAKLSVPEVKNSTDSLANDQCNAEVTDILKNADAIGQDKDAKPCNTTAKDSFPKAKNDSQNSSEFYRPSVLECELKRIKVKRRKSASKIRSSTPPPPTNIMPFFPRFSLPGGGSPPLISTHSANYSDEYSSSSESNYAKDNLNESDYRLSKSSLPSSTHPSTSDANFFATTSFSGLNSHPRLSTKVTTNSKEKSDKIKKSVSEKTASLFDKSDYVNRVIKKFTLPTASPFMNDAFAKNHLPSPGSQKLMPSNCSKSSINGKKTLPQPYILGYIPFPPELFQRRNTVGTSSGVNTSSQHVNVMPIAYMPTQNIMLPTGSISSCMSTKSAPSKNSMFELSSDARSSSKVVDPIESDHSSFLRMQNSHIKRQEVSIGHNRNTNNSNMQPLLNFSSQLSPWALKHARNINGSLGCTSKKISSATHDSSES